MRDEPIEALHRIGRSERLVERTVDAQRSEGERLRALSYSKSMLLGCRTPAKALQLLQPTPCGR
jgi:hypothetical protein